MGGCQNHGLFLDPYSNMALNILGTRKGTINIDNHPYTPCIGKVVPSKRPIQTPLMVALEPLQP